MHFPHSPLEKGFLFYSSNNLYYLLLSSHNGLHSFQKEFFFYIFSFALMRYVFITKMTLGFQIRVGDPLIGIGLTETPNSRWAKAHLAHPVTALLLTCYDIT